MDFKEKTITIIDFLLKSGRQKKNDRVFSMQGFIIEESLNKDLEKIFKILQEHQCFHSFCLQKDNGNGAIKLCSLEFKGMNTIALFTYKQKILDQIQDSIINPKALEQIAKKLEEHYGNNYELMKFLEGVGVMEYLIVYKNTKNSLAYDVFIALATSKDQTFHRLLFTIFEVFCHPINFGGDKIRASEIQDRLSNLLEYDRYCFHDNKITQTTPEILEEIEKRCFQRELIRQGACTSHSHDIQSFLSPQIDFTKDENIKYKEKVYYGLSSLEKALCRKIFTEGVNFCFKTIEVEEFVYLGHEATKNRQDKLKKLVERLNKTIKTAFGIAESIRYSTETIRRLV